VTLRSIPAPVVTWEKVVSTNDPTRTPSRAQIRTLRQNGLVSEGLRVQTRRDGRAAGSATYHSTLFALALKAGQAGDQGGAEVLRRRGKQIESRFAKRIREYLTDHALDALEQAPFFGDLSGATERAVEEWSRRGRMDIVFATGRVQGLTEESVIIELKYHHGTAPVGEPVDVDLPRTMAEGSGLNAGDHVWIFRRTLGSAALLDLLPAIATTAAEAEGEAEAEDVARTDDVDAAERVAGERYLRSGAGARPTSAEAEFLRSRRGRVSPRRVVRPAG
jgi:hypothetical protein